MADLPGVLTLNELQAYVARTCMERGFADETLAQKFMLLSEELGEFAKAARRDAGIKTADASKRDVALEAADVLFVFLNTCSKLDIDIEAAFRAKEAINNSRTWK